MAQPSRTYNWTQAQNAVRQEIGDVQLDLSEREARRAAATATTNAKMGPAYSGSITRTFNAPKSICGLEDWLCCRGGKGARHTPKDPTSPPWLPPNPPTGNSGGGGGASPQTGESGGKTVFVEARLTPQQREAAMATQIARLEELRAQGSLQRHQLERELAETRATLQLVVPPFPENASQEVPAQPGSPAYGAAWVGQSPQSPQSQGRRSRYKTGISFQV